MKPIPGLECVRPLDEFLVFEVTSPDSGKVYRIDKSLWFGSGACSCEDFACRIQVALGRGDWSGKTTCKHINLVDRFLACEVARRAIAHRQTKTYNPSEPNL